MKRFHYLKRLLPLVASSVVISCATGESKSSGESEHSTTEIEATSDGASAEFAPLLLTYPSSEISYEVSADADSLRIQVRGLSLPAEELKHDIKGHKVLGAEVGDLNVDGYPELFVFLRSLGADGRGSLVAYSPNAGKSVSQIYLPDLVEDPAFRSRYKGGDEMAVVEDTFVLRFPIYMDVGGKSIPTGKTKQIQYKLTDSESGRVLRIDKVLEY